MRAITVELETEIRLQLQLVKDRVRNSLGRRLAEGEDGIPAKMDCSDGEDNGWKMALEWVLSKGCA
jgi:hypothetical protein